MRARQLQGSRRTRRWLGVVPLALLWGAGCSPQEIPHVPTYEADIRPLVLSRCVRCHGGGGKLNADPTADPPFKDFPPIDGFFDRFDDPPCADAGTSSCLHGMRFFATDMVKKGRLITYLHPEPNQPRMPPPPSPALTTTQLQIFDAWLAEAPPLEK